MQKKVGIIYRKNCDKCNRPSYSSSEIGSWKCPICHNDLTNYPFFDAITFEQIHIHYVLKKALKGYQNVYYPNDHSTNQNKKFNA
ncbi:hypothetical protein [Niallia sp. 03133]|uniref:hypothetical protein n=1 Tax=Niallia sp. 03133 TaxID=3458060 RepID=UPI004044E268